MDLYQIWFRVSSRRRNQLCEILLQSTHGFRFCEGSKFAISHWLGRSPLTQCWRYRAACDLAVTNKSRSTSDLAVLPVEYAIYVGYTHAKYRRSDGSSAANSPALQIIVGSRLLHIYTQKPVVCWVFSLWLTDVQNCVEHCSNRLLTMSSTVFIICCLESVTLIWLADYGRLQSSISCADKPI